MGYKISDIVRITDIKSKHLLQNKRSAIPVYGYLHYSQALKESSKQSGPPIYDRVNLDPGIT